MALLDTVLRLELYCVPVMPDKCIIIKEEMRNNWGIWYCVVCMACVLWTVMLLGPNGKPLILPFVLPSMCFNIQNLFFALVALGLIEIPPGDWDGNEKGLGLLPGHPHSWEFRNAKGPNALTDLPSARSANHCFPALPLFSCLWPSICWRFVLQLFLPITVMLMCPLVKPWTHLVSVGG